MKNQVKMRISTKIIAAITIITLFTAAFIGIIVGIQVTGTVGDLSTQYATMQVQQETNEINEGFTQIEMSVGQFSRQIADTVDVDMAKSDIEYLRDLTDEYEEMFREYGEETGATNSIYVYFNVDLFGDAADCWVYGDDFARQDMIEASYYDGTQDWYDTPVREGITRWTEPYAVAEGEAAGQLVTSYVTPVEKDGVIIGMLGMDMNLNNAQEVLYAVTLFETGYIYMMQPDGTLLIHERLPWEDTTGDGAPDTPVNMLDVGDFQFLIDDFESEESGFTEYTRDDGADVFAAFSHLDNGWIIGSSIPKDEVYASVSRLIMIIVGIAIFALVVAIILAFVLSKTITRPILDVVNVAKKMSDGDFTERVECKTNDETKLLADAVNEMSDHVSGLIKDTKNVSTKIVTSASDLATMAEDATASAEQAARSVEEISKGTIDTAAEATKSSEAVTVMDDKFGEMMENSAIMQENAQEAIETNKAGLEALNLLKEKSQKGNESNQKISKVVKELASETTKITAIIGTISSIAEQTNLLALNASIEAARAGEAGKGFAVVAEEIRQLAEDSAKATQGIADIINKIEADTKNSVVVMEEVEEIALEQGGAVENVNTSFDSIFKAVENITNVVEDVIKALDVLNEQNSELVSVSSNISAVSEETAAATQEVNASMTMQENTMQEVSKSADMLNKMSVQLNEQIEQFKVN